MAQSVMRMDVCEVLAGAALAAHTVDETWPCVTRVWRGEGLRKIVVLALLLCGRLATVRETRGHTRGYKYKK